MLKFMDYFFYKTYLFCRFLKKDIDDSRWSSMLHVGLWSFFFAFSCVCLAGLLVDNPISLYAKHHSKVAWMATLIVCTVLVGLRYFVYYKGITFIERYYESIKGFKRVILELLFYLSLIGLPVALFTLSRWYIFN